jgi:hypothetical protein
MAIMSSEGFLKSRGLVQTDPHARFHLHDATFVDRDVDRPEIERTHLALNEVEPGFIGI